MNRCLCLTHFDSSPVSLRPKDCLVTFLFLVGASREFCAKTVQFGSNWPFETLDGLRKTMLPLWTERVRCAPTSGERNVCFGKGTTWALDDMTTGGTPHCPSKARLVLISLIKSRLGEIMKEWFTLCGKFSKFLSSAKNRARSTTTRRLQIHSAFANFCLGRCSTCCSVPCARPPFR
jgi:hypothetical protein